jgi:DNA polymerase I
VLAAFREIVVADFEFAVTPGNRPVPVCLVAHELKSGRQFRIWQDQFTPAPPYTTGPDVLFVAYYASAELGCYHVLGWPMPERILDLFCEFRARTNGLETPAGNGLLGALAYFGLDSIGAGEKDEMRQLALRGRLWSEAERVVLLDYCESDVVRWNGCCPPCCRQSTCREHYCAVDIWPLPQSWSTTARRSMCRCSNYSASVGPISKTN